MSSNRAHLSFMLRGSVGRKKWWVWFHSQQPVATHTHTHSSQHDGMWPQREWRGGEDVVSSGLPADIRSQSHSTGVTLAGPVGTHTYTQRDLMCYSYIKDSDSQRSQFVGLLPFIFYLLLHTLLQLKEATKAFKGTVLKQSLIMCHSQTCMTFFHLRNAN